MAKMSKGMAYKTRVVAGDGDPKIQVEKSYVSAYQKGYSVIEIARQGGFKSAKFVHAALVKNGAVPAGKPGPQIKGLIPKKMRIHLTTRGLTFAQWCAGRGFEQAEVKKEVDELSGAAMAAIKVDFPGYYKILTGMEVDDDDERYKQPVKFEKQFLSASITWDVNEGCYRAEISPFKCTGHGPSLQIALKSAQLKLWVTEIARRLDLLPDKKDLQKELIW